MSQKIQKLDPDFKFGEAYKINYCTLINLSFEVVIMEQSFFVDNKLQKLQYPKKLFCLLYREWRNSSWFQLLGPIENMSYFWSTVDSAETFKKEMVIHHGLVLISEKEAFKVAQLNLEL